jgi:hypothetical protein
MLLTARKLHVTFTRQIEDYICYRGGFPFEDLEPCLKIKDKTLSANESPLQSTANVVEKNDSQVAVLPQHTQFIQSKASLGITTRLEERDFVRMQKLRSSPQHISRLL